jgi:hypothetical protein
MSDKHDPCSPLCRVTPQRSQPASLTCRVGLGTGWALWRPTRPSAKGAGQMRIEFGPATRLPLAISRSHSRGSMRTDPRAILNISAVPVHGGDLTRQGPCGPSPRPGSAAGWRMTM